MTSTDAPIACTLDATSIRDRLEWIRSVQKRALLSHYRDGSVLHLTFDAAAKHEVRALVRREQRCCAFLRFELAKSEREVRLTVAVPAQASDSVDELLSYFEPAPGRSALQR